MWRIAVANISIIAAIVVAVEIASYFVLPSTISASLPHYRKGLTPSEDDIGHVRFYHEAHAERGYDIAPGKKAMHAVDGFRYPVWSNKLGCFDVAQNEAPGRYYYFAGDSFTWGFTNFEDKFATIFERERGIQSLKCGVIGTGQQHQFSKFKDIVARIGRLPATVVVALDTTDFSDDYVFPNSTVLDGQLLNTRFIDSSFGIVDVDQAWLRAQLDRVAEIKQREESRSVVVKAARNYSLTLNLLNALISRGGAGAAWTTGGAARQVEDASVLGPSHLSFNGRTIYHSFRLSGAMIRSGVLGYTSNPYADRQKAAIRRWKDHAGSSGYRLIFVLLPAKEHHDNPGYFGEVREYLDQVGVEHIDLTEEFRRSGFRRGEMYWPVDGHLSVQGNRAVGKILVRRLP